MRGGYIIHQEFTVADRKASPSDLKTRCFIGVGRTCGRWGGCCRWRGVHIAKIPSAVARAYEMDGGRINIDKGNGDFRVFDSGEEKNAKGHLVCLGKNSAPFFFIDLDPVNNKSPKPVEVDRAYLDFAFERFFKAFNGDLFDQPWKYHAIKIKGEGGQEK